LKIHEYQAMEIFARYGLPVSGFDVVTSPEEARAAAEKRGGSVVVKAQVHVGGRGKAGGVKLARDADEAERLAEGILGMDIKGLTVEKVVVAEVVDIDREYYIGIVVDRATKKPVYMVSSEGGVDIEVVASETPEKIHKHPVDPERGLSDAEAAELAAKIESEPSVAAQVADAILKLYAAFVGSDASLAEINPLVVTSEGVVRAIDAKMNIDDNALYRHEDIAAMRDTSTETAELTKARELGMSFVKLDGNVGCLVNGAGLAMTTMDLIKQHGGEPANFLDVGGSSNSDKVATALEIITSDPNVRSLLINIFGGITRCDDVARGLVHALERVATDVPIVVRLTGTNAEEARRILAEYDLMTADTLDEAVEKAVVLAGRDS
jgi:succinyl-CoA synthetase beta subunit